ncbi:MAG: MaoC family dehydratase N-terminal domain-containing protein [Deltaproteobacteria bacterium]|jgi:acyl dehydratase|nr:MaoC family dehydratase N-terminal domain-containing protein [Syntrophaceae bacterium]
MNGKYFDDWTLNEEFTTPTRTITETDVVMFAATSGDYNELHTSAEVTKANQFGQRIAHGLLVLGISHGLLFRTGFLDQTAIAFLSVNDWKFQAPIFFGDTVRVKFKCSEKKESKSKQDRGVITLYLEVLNQNNVVVQSGYKSIMMKRVANR